LRRADTIGVQTVAEVWCQPLRELVIDQTLARQRRRMTTICGSKVGNDRAKALGCRVKGDWNPDFRNRTETSDAR